MSDEPTTEHIAKHGRGTCDRYTGTVWDVLIWCPKCGGAMEHHCCHHCCLKCGIDARGRNFTAATCAGCGHPMHDDICTVPVITHHFEGTDHGGIVPCGHIAEAVGNQP